MSPTIIFAFVSLAILKIEEPNAPHPIINMTSSSSISALERLCIAIVVGSIITESASLRLSGNM